MTNQVALILAAAIIGLSIVGARLVGRYEISAGGRDTNGISIVWRVDTLTGDVQICMVTPSNNPFDKAYYVKCRQSVVGIDVVPKQ